MLKLLIFSFCLCGVYGYFTLPGKCPINVPVQDNFRFEDFYGTWHQVYHHSSDGQQQNNCSTVELTTEHGQIYFNISRVDRGLFHRFSEAKVLRAGDEEGILKVKFDFENDARRVKSRKYDVYVLATNYNYYATLYTCQYSPLIDKHFVYIWILSRKPSLNEVSKALALRPLQSIGVSEDVIVKDDLSKCIPKYYDDIPTKPYTFRFPVKI